MTNRKKWSECAIATFNNKPEKHKQIIKTKPKTYTKRLKQKNNNKPTKQNIKTMETVNKKTERMRNRSL